MTDHELQKQQEELQKQRDHEADLQRPYLHAIKRGPKGGGNNV